VKPNKKTSSTALSAVALLIQVALPPSILAEHGDTAAPQWSVKGEKIDAGDVNLESAFQVAIYENLLVELSKTRNFKHVFRSGDRHTDSLHDLLILKTKVERYTPGSETKRAVTTVAGATKLKVLSQLCTPEGHVVLERTITGNVRLPALCH